MKQIEAEGGELLIQNNLGSYAIIPKKDVETLRNHILEGCHDCIDKYVTSLPSYEMANGKAEDGVLISDNPDNPNPKIEEARNWVVDWLRNRKLEDPKMQELYKDSQYLMLKQIKDIPINEVVGDTSENNVAMYTSLTDDYKNLMGIYSPEKNKIEVLSGVEKGTTVAHEGTHAADSKMKPDLLSKQESAVWNNTKPITKVSDANIKQRYANAKETLPKFLKGIDSKYQNLVKERIDSIKSEGLTEQEAMNIIKEEDIDNLSTAMNEYRQENPLEYERIKPLIGKDINWEDFVYANNVDKLSGKFKDLVKKRLPTTFKKEEDYIQNSKKQTSFFNDYVKDFDEVHARIMEIRKDLDIKPDQVIDQKFIDDNRDKLKKNDAYLDIMEVTKEGDKSLINLLNKLVDVEKNDNGIKNS